MLTEQIRAIDAWARGAYGAPRIHAERKDQGIGAGCKRVARMMRAAGWHGISRCTGLTTTRRRERARPAPDLVEHAFTARAPNPLWAADITCVPMAAGFLHRAVVPDAFTEALDWRRL